MRRGPRAPRPWTADTRRAGRPRKPANRWNSRAARAGAQPLGRHQSASRPTCRRRRKTEPLRASAVVQMADAMKRNPADKPRRVECRIAEPAMMKHRFDSTVSRQGAGCSGGKAAPAVRERIVKAHVAGPIEAERAIDGE